MYVLQILTLTTVDGHGFPSADLDLFVIIRQKSIGFCQIFYLKVKGLTSWSPRRSWAWNRLMSFKGFEWFLRTWIEMGLQDLTKIEASLICGKKKKKKMALGGFKWLVLLLFFLVLFVFV
jgi:hypothetical protein